MFDELTGNARVKAALKRLLLADRLPGALLFTGEEGIGKKLFALEVARALNCRTPKDHEACGVCSSCVRIRTVNYPQRDDAEEWTQIIWTNHPDVGLVVAPKRVLRVEQMRQIEKEANFRPFEGKARVFLIDEADKLNDASANALLKVLEEPPKTSHLILITARPAMLLPTILSRCQMIRFSPLTPDEVETHLLKNNLVDTKTARLRARAAGGSIGRALSGDLATFTSQRKSMLKVLNALVLSDDRAQLLRSAEALAASKDRSDYEESLDVLETLIRDAWSLSLGRSAESTVNIDRLKDLERIAAELRSEKAAVWLTTIEELRGALEVNINRKIASDGLVVSMATA